MYTLGDNHWQLHLTWFLQVASWTLVDCGWNGGSNFGCSGTFHGFSGCFSIFCSTVFWTFSKSLDLLPWHTWLVTMSALLLFDPNFLGKEKQKPFGSTVPCFQGTMGSWTTSLPCSGCSKTSRPLGVTQIEWRSSESHQAAAGAGSRLWSTGPVDRMVVLTCFWHVLSYNIHIYIYNMYNNV